MWTNLISIIEDEIDRKCTLRDRLRSMIVVSEIGSGVGGGVYVVQLQTISNCFELIRYGEIHSCKDDRARAEKSAIHVRDMVVDQIFNLLEARVGKK